MGSYGNGGKLMVNCRHCNKPFEEAKPWQVCCERCQQDWHLHQRKLARQEKLFARLKEQDEARANGGRLDRGTPEQRQAASEVLAQIVEGRRSARRIWRRM